MNIYYEKALIYSEMNIILCIYSKMNIERGDKKMKINRQKYELARARACKGQKDLEADGIPKGTLCRIIGGGDARPETVGKIARSLGVDVTEIIETE